jgi:tripartite-type tricarboxylate transporter receptor subunit TctC
VIVGFPAGQAADSLARIVSQGLSDRLKQQFLVENRPGAGGNIGSETVAKAAPDGYTILMEVMTSNATTPRSTSISTSTFGRTSRRSG